MNAPFVDKCAAFLRDMVMAGLTLLTFLLILGLILLAAGFVRNSMHYLLK